jgi:hypothetical protein
MTKGFSARREFGPDSVNDQIINIINASKRTNIDEISHWRWSIIEQFSQMREVITNMAIFKSRPDLPRSIIAGYLCQ